MNPQTAETQAKDATAAQLVAAIYTVKDAQMDMAVRRELNRAAGHIKLALADEDFVDVPMGDAGFAPDVKLGEASMLDLAKIAKLLRLPAIDAHNAAAVRELRRARAHILCAIEHSLDDPHPSDLVIEHGDDLVVVVPLDDEEDDQEA
jgi:hypothetical protein